jgi:hypothetical protein
MTEEPQHMRALATANEIRFGRARLHCEVKALGGDDGFRRVADLLEENPQCLSSLRILDMLMWIHRVGVGRSRRFLRHAEGAQVSERATVGSITPRQRRSLARALRQEVEPEAEAA